MKKRILVLCTGNSCRSQMAHGFLQSLGNDIEVFSAGTHPAKQVNPLAVKVMAEAGIDISSHTPHALDEYLNDHWDHIITVCGKANESCPLVKNRIHIGFDDPSDAVGTEEFAMSEFRRVRDEIKREMAKFYLVTVKGLHLPQCSCQR